MANPTSRHCRSRRDKRRAGWKGSNLNLVKCPECSEPKESHKVCSSCGTYNKRKVLEIVEKEA